MTVELVKGLSGVHSGKIMSSILLRLRRRTESAERWLALPSSRLALSLLIILSVLPDSAQGSFLPERITDHLPYFFLLVFGFELLLRSAILCNHWLQKKATGWEVLLLLLDLAAVISFLPLEGLFDGRSLRLVRLMRLLLLAAYWGDLGRDFLDLLRRRELRNQIVLVLFLGLVLSLVGAVVADHVAPTFDFDGDGVTGDPDDRNFSRVLWWSFRQVQDPGNLVGAIDQPAVVALSLVLTFAGLLVLALVIGIGTSAIEELLRRAREKPVGLEGHSVILGTTDHSKILLEGLAQIYLKNLRPFRATLLGSNHPPDFLDRPSMRRVHFRHGNPVEVEDLDRVAIGRARRVLILGSDPDDPDGEAISAVLATRRSNPSVDLYPEIDHERNFGATRTAGGPRTHVVGTGSFLGHYLVHQVVYPGSVELYRRLLHSSGCEIYTYIFSARERRELVRGNRGNPLEPEALYTRCFFDYGVNLIGLLVPPEDDGEIQAKEWEDDELEAILNPVLAARSASPSAVFDGHGGIHWERVWGVIGIGLRWRQLRELATDLYRSPGIFPSRPFPPASIDLPPLVLPRSSLGKVAIYGGSERIPRVVVELLAFQPDLQIEVLVANAHRFATLTRDIRAMAGTIRGQISAIEESDRELVIQLQSEQRSAPARITLRMVPWNDVHRLLQEGILEVHDLDTLLLLPETRSRDGAVALDCLHLANLASRGLLRHRPHLHIVGLVRDPIKGELLESRLRRLAGGKNAMRFSILSSEKTRHEYIVQNVFVRGLNSLFLDLLSAEGQHLGRLDVPGDGLPLHGMDTISLSGSLLRHGLILIGLVVQGKSGTHIELQISELSGLAREEWDTLRSVYVLGSREVLETIDQKTMALVGVSSSA